MNYSYTDYSGHYDASAHISPDVAGMGLAILGGFFIVFLLIVLVFYIFTAICLMKIAKKTNTPNGWLAWIPIANIILMLQIAEKPIWWIVLALIPFVNIVWVILGIIIWMAIAKRLNKPEWWGILTIVPIVNLVVYGYLAFSKDEDTPAQPANSAPPIQPAA